MPKFIVDLWLDGYDSEEEMEKACEKFMEDQLDFTASSVKVEKVPNKIIVNQRTQIITINGMDFSFDCLIQLMSNTNMSYIIEEDGKLTPY
jgi:hypothetical protein